LNSPFQSLKKNRDFQAVYRGGSSKVNRLFVMIIRKNNSKENRVGISVSKKVGNSVVRHRITRVVREIFRHHWGDVADGYDIVVVARTAAKESNYRSMESAVLHLLKLHHLLEKN
jgi:ribonuclease P protein component